MEGVGICSDPWNPTSFQPRSLRGNNNSSDVRKATHLFIRCVDRPGAGKMHACVAARASTLQSSVQACTGELDEVVPLTQRR
eukprot:COSAG02_NODE_5298_length_4461_cov_2.071068_3_plen_82_part_00